MVSAKQSCCDYKNVFSKDAALEQHGTLMVDETLLAREMNALTVQEREKVYEEIHGVAGPVKETPELVASSLIEMRAAIVEIPPHRRKAYSRAMFLRPSLEHDDKYNLMFLRAQRFDPVKAAHHICRSFEHKLKLFGDEKLAKKITLDDLGETERNIHMYSGAIQLLPSTDSGGRHVLVMLGPMLDLNEDFDSIIRYAWYQIYSAIEENEEIQKRGMVHVLCGFGEWNRAPHRMLEFVIHSIEFSNDWPARLCSNHFCADQSRFHRAGSTMFALRCKELRIRNRMHFGSKLEVQYSLMPFGIDLSAFLDPGQGTLSKRYIDAYLEDRRLKEAEAERLSMELLASRPGSYFYPTPKDVIMGRGRPYVSWPGNVRLPKLVSKYIYQYTKASNSRNGKSAVAMEVVDAVRQEGGRFLYRGQNGYWQEASDQKARDKVSQIFRAEIRSRDAKDQGSNYEGMDVDDDIAMIGPLSSDEILLFDELDESNTAEATTTNNKRLRIN